MQSAARKLSLLLTLCPEKKETVAKEGVRNSHHCSGAINDATDKWLPQ